MGKLEGKVAIVTGASGGIGRIVALLFAEEKAKVIVASRNTDAGEETVRMIDEAGDEAMFVKTDVTNAQDVKQMVKMTVDSYGKLDILYNNAAIVGKPASTIELTVEDWNKIVATNLTGVWLGMKYGIPEMIKAGGGSIINVSSLAAHVGVPNQMAYSATKGGVISMSRVAAVEYASKNIRVNCISPGPVATPLLVDFYGEEGTKYLSSLNPQGRLGAMEEVAKLAVFLASDESSHIIGQTIVIDGGHTADSHIRW